MDEEIRTEKSVYLEKAKNLWNDFGPLVLGAIVLLVVLAGAWYLWKNRAIQQAEAPTVIQEQEAQKNPEAYLPASQIKFPEATPTPTATPSPLPSPSPRVVAQTKSAIKNTSKGEQLPKTGLPEILLIISAASVAGGALLKKFSKRI